jgi:hypothetical protein
MVFVFESRTKLQWTKLQIMKYFAIRGLIIWSLELTILLRTFCLVTLLKFAIVLMYMQNGFKPLIPGKYIFFGVLYALSINMILSGPILIANKMVAQQTRFPVSFL